MVTISLTFYFMSKTLLQVICIQSIAFQSKPSPYIKYLWSILYGTVFSKPKVVASQLAIDMGSFVVYVVWVFIFASVFHQKNGHSSTQLNATCSIETDILHCYKNIPEHVPDGISEVVLHNLRNETVLAESVFGGPGWNNITSLTIGSRRFSDVLTFKENSFVNLVKLESLSLHLSQTVFVPGAFNGLLNVVTLDMTNSSFIKRTDFNNIILKPGTFPKLDKLVLVRLGIDQELYLNETFWQQIEAKPITNLDISYVQAHEFNYTAMVDHCTQIRIFRARGLHVGHMYGEFRRLNRLPNLEVLDLSEYYITDNIACIVPRLEDRSNFTANTRHINVISSISELYLDNLCVSHRSATPHYVLKNISNIRLESSVPWNVKLLSFNGNSLTYFDVGVIGTYLTLETLLLAQNDMEYFNPESLLTVTRLKHLDLSDNRLGLMSRRNSSIFQSALVHLPELKNIILARNELSFLPDQFFERNDKLQIINIAGNFLEQIHFTVRHLYVLEVLNVSHNSIKTLDVRSMNNLKSVLIFNKTGLHLKGNPISCNVCHDLDFIVWLVEHKYRIVDWNHLSCANAEDKRVCINKQTLHKLTGVCERPKLIIIWSAVCISCFIGIVTMTTLIVKRLKKRGFTKRRRKLIQNIANPEPGFEFAVFLAHSDADFNTVIRHMLPPLEHKLQEVVGVERDLVFLGDKHYQVGYPIFEETMRSIKISCSIMFVVTDAFCRSNYCQIELQQAYDLHKPIILVMEQTCDQELMSPLLNELFNRNTRVIWLGNDGNVSLP